MSVRHRAISEKTKEMQARAADPDVSAWVSANAGSGKTHVLATRVIRLLLAGADPSKILCLTYTKAAAGEMKKRIFAKLGEWAICSDDVLPAKIAELVGHAPQPDRLADARRLFARALDTPGGLKIQTIHAFCEAILKRFPLEANIAGHFEMLDDVESAALIAAARRGLLSGLEDPDRPTLSAAFARVLDRAGESGLEKLLAAIVDNRDALRDFLDALGVVHDDLFVHFGFAPDDDEAAIVTGLWPDCVLGDGFAAALLDAARAAGGQTAIDLSENLVAAQRENDPIRRFNGLVGVFLKADGEPRNPKNLLAKGIAERFPLAGPELARKSAEVHAAVDRVATLGMVRDTDAALTLADAMLARYERMKAARGRLDFNDLIHRTLTLLSRSDAARWVQYKLDQGIDHLLVDEAQDTSPTQWGVIAGIVSEFFAGEGARGNVNRTLFAVGDEKQSIYSFQGADPAAFAEYRDRYRRLAGGVGKPFEPVNLRQSFRSVEDVLAFVDEVFRDPEARKGLTRDPESFEHETVRVGVPGYVELWPSRGAPDIGDEEDWRVAVDHAKAASVQLAQDMATTIAGWIGGGETIEDRDGKRGTIRPRDIIVLVRKRDRFMHALSRALKEKAVPAAGVDRLRLSAHIAVQDMIALGRVCLQPHDDLSLAALLKSPVFGLDDDALFVLAADRGDASLWSALQRHALNDVALAAVEGMLTRWRSEIDIRSPFEFYAGILGRDGVRRRMQARLGPEAAEILDEFLSYGLASEKAGLAGMEAFLAALAAAAPEIKREAGDGRDEVRVMTAHAAKGLEAPIVFLVDSGGAPSHVSHLPTLMRFPVALDGRERNGFVWRSGKETQNRWRRAREAELQAAAEDEYRRLLYVGLTRAADRLIICGYHRKTEYEGRWHAIATRAFDRLANRVETRPDAATGAPIRRYTIADHPSFPPDIRLSGAPTPGPQLPTWLARPLEAEPAPPRPLAPSGVALIAEADLSTTPAFLSPVFSPAADSAFAIRRGQAIHRLLQILPGLDAGSQAAAGERYLARIGADWPPPERSRALQTVLATLAEPDFSAVFAAGSRAEVAIQGVLRIGGRDRVIAGKIDRLAIGDAVVIVDYKTNRPPPAGLDGVSASHVAQLALYRRILAALHPGKPIHAGLLFVDAPRLIAIPTPAMDAALARLDAALRAP